MLSAAKHLLFFENKRLGFLALLGMTSLADFFTAADWREGERLASALLCSRVYRRPSQKAATSDGRFHAVQRRFHLKNLPTLGIPDDRGSEAVI